MLRIVGLCMVLILVYAVIRTFKTHTKIGKRLLQRDKLKRHLSQQEILELMETAFWLEGPVEFKTGQTSSDAGTQSVDVVCKDVTYRIASEPCGDGSAVLKVDSIYEINHLIGLFSTRSLRYLQGENRIRCHIMSSLDPAFMEHPREFYADINAAHIARYSVIAVIMTAALIGNALYKGTSGFVILCSVFAIVTFILWAFQDYGEQMIYEKLLDGDPVPEYWDNESLMGLLRDSLRIETLKRLYFGPRGEVLAETSHGTYRIAVTFQNPKLFVSLHGGADDLEAYLEADYIRSAVIKLIDASQQGDLEAKKYSMFLVSGLSRVCAKIGNYSIILLIAGLILNSVLSTREIDFPLFSPIEINMADSRSSVDRSAEQQPSVTPAPTTAPDPVIADPDPTPADPEPTSPEDDLQPSDTLTSDASEDTQYWGEYRLISSDPYWTAELDIIFISDGALMYLSGNAAYGDNVAELYGELEILDNQHFYYEDPELESSLSLTYDPDTRLLEVSEDGSFGGLGVTFEGTYAQISGSIIP